MSLQLCQITGTIYQPNGSLAVGKRLKIIQARENLIAFTIPPFGLSIDPSDSNGIITFTLPQGATVRLQGDVYIGGQSLRNGIEYAIPNQTTAALETLTPVVTVPQTNLSNHAATIAGPNQLGHIKGGGQGYSIDPDGTLQVNNVSISQEVVEDYLANFFNSQTPALHFTYNDPQDRFDISIDSATQSVSGLLSSVDKTKLDGIASGATANQADSYLLNRANHTGTQLANTVSDFNPAVDARISGAIGVSVEAYNANLAAIAALTPANNDLLQRKAGVWTNRTPAQVKTDLAIVPGDIIGFNASASAAAPVQSVNGQTGAVALTLPTNTSATAHQFLTGYNSTTGVFSSAQPSASDVAGLAPSATTDTTTSANITDSLNKRFITDAQRTVLGNTSGTNTGDQDLSGLVPKTTTVNGHALGANVSVSASDVGLGNVPNVDATNASNITTGTLSTNRLPYTPANLAGDTFTGTVKAPTIGINLGSVSPPTAFTVGDTVSTTPRGLMSWQASNDTSSAHLHMRKSRGTFSVPATILSGDILGRVVFAGYEGTNYIESAYIRATSTGTVQTNRVPSKLELFTSTDASPSVATVALTLNADQSAQFANTVSATTFVGALTGTASGNLTPSNNLSDLASAATARTNLNLGNVTNDAQTKAAIVPNTAPSSGQVLVGNAGGTAYAPQSLSGDATLTNAGVLTVTKTNGTAFAASATTDTTNAANITTGTLNANRVPDLSATYPLLAGKSGGQTISGGTGASENLTLQSTTNPTKGFIYFGSGAAYDGANQRFGIGTQSPSALFETAATSGTHALLSAWSTAGGTGATLQLGRARSSAIGTHGNVAAGDRLGNVVFGGDSAVGGNFESGAEIRGEADAVTSGHVLGRLLFFTATTGGVETERVRIDSGGLVGINKSSSLGAQLHVASSAASTIGAIVQAAASPTASLQEWRDSTGAAKAKVTSGFTFVGNRATYTGVVGTTTLNLANGNTQVFTFAAGNETIALSNIPDSATIVLHVIQDSTGSRTITWPASIKWVGGSAPTLSTGASKRDVFLFSCDGTNCYEVSRALDVR